jgi:hypothetical protein
MSRSYTFFDGYLLGLLVAKGELCNEDIRLFVKEMAPLGEISNKSTNKRMMNLQAKYPKVKGSYIHGMWRWE